MPIGTSGPNTAPANYEALVGYHPNARRFIAEGDSWFAFPLMRMNFLDCLDARNGKAALIDREFSKASSGHTVAQITADKNLAAIRKRMMKFAQKGIGYHALLLSGGGNDIVGEELNGFLYEKKPGMTWHDCINTKALDKCMKTLRAGYEKVIALRDAVDSECWIFTHLYDYAFPDGTPVHVWPLKVGPWMQPALRGHKITTAEDQQQIIWHILDTFRDMLLPLERAHGNFRVANTLGTLERDDWGDELHPTGPGFMKIAKVFQRALRDEFPELPNPANWA